MTADLTLGNQRLLQLAEILDTADERHRERGEPTYDQMSYDHTSGTPSCAAGHWAAANPERWSLELMRLHKESQGIKRDICNEFHLSDDEFEDLFSMHGCDRADNSLHAAAYIRAFVARRNAS